MIRTTVAVAAGALAISAAFAPVEAQTTRTSGAVRGQVQGPDGEAVAGAAVLLRDVERGVTREARTDGDGRFTFGLLLPGTYLYAVRSRSAELEGGAAGPVRVRAGDRSTVRVTVEPDRYVYSETGNDLGLAVSEAGVVDLVDQAQLEHLPADRRDWKSLFLLSGLVNLAQDGSFRMAAGGDLPVLVDGQE